MDLKGVDQKTLEKVGGEKYFAREKKQEKKGEEAFFKQGEKAEVRAKEALIWRNVGSAKTDMIQ